jgi:D-amino peptidase
MKIFITADIEGVNGATKWEETDQTNQYFLELREQMTAEVKAACEGALNAGASEIVVKDSHGWGCNILHKKLPREARLIRAWTGHPFSMMQGIDKSFDATLVVGYHSQAGNDGSPLAHTMTGNMASVKINGLLSSEFVMSAYTSGYVGVPVAFLAGDAALCAHAKAFIPGITTVAVKECEGNGTDNLHPDVAVELIRENVEKALKGDLAKCAVQMPKVFNVEMGYKRHQDAHTCGFYPGAKQTGPHTVEFSAADYFDVLRFFEFCIR